MEISALTRSVVHRSHALISPDGYINSVVPGWTGCTVNVIINEQMGARFCQTMITLQQGGVLDGATVQSQLFFYVVGGKGRMLVGADSRYLFPGHFVYIPAGKDYHFESAEDGTQLLSFQKLYEPLKGAVMSSTLFGNAGDIAGKEYLGDPALRLQVLLPDDLSFDMAVNIFTYDPGGHLPM